MSDVPDPALAGAAVRRVLWRTLWLNICVSTAKIIVGWLSGSLAMLADGYHSLLDGGNNVIGLVVTSWAYEPPDESHPYGHRKFETAAAVGLGILLLGMSYGVASSAFQSFTSPELPVIGFLNWLVIGVTLAVNVGVATYEAREGRRLGSEYLLADAAHTRSDVYVTLGVVASFAGVRAGLDWVDGVVALGIAAFIGVLAVRILVGAFNVLTDRSPIPAQGIVSVVAAVAGVEEVRSVRARGGPGSTYVDVVAVMDARLTLRAAHDVADAIEAALERAFPDIVDVVVHPEPTDEPLPSV
jgi:cation diffusion facilitator family transporter